MVRMAASRCQGKTRAEALANGFRLKSAFGVCIVSLARQVAADCDATRKIQTDVMKILVISMAGIGDTLMATPLIHELRANFPDAVIDAMVMWAGSRDLLQGNPHLTSVMHKKLIGAGVAETSGFLGDLRRRHYDVSFNTYPQSRLEYRLVARYIASRKRLGHSYDKWTLVDRALVTGSVPQDYGVHAVENNLNLLKLMDVAPQLASHEYEVFLGDEDRAWAQRYAEQVSGSILGLHVGSGTTKNLPLRRWPLDNWIALIERLLAENPRVSVYLFGGPEERNDHQAILARIQTERVRVPETRNLRQAAALLEKCHAFLSVDTALMHLAAAAKVPRQFVIETPTFNKTVEPYARPFILIPNPMVAGRNLEYYRYDGKGIKGDPEHLTACMRSITVDAVLQRLVAVID